ncbi:MAG TPA: CocE/NonD family hydrolase [Kineosporiaceae bacterium]|nr:CocE/NonD family hydrolase [Kineosporiaceae bacterium]
MTADVETQTPVRTPGGPARLLDRALTRALRLPPPRTGFHVEQDRPITMRDGVVLLGDHYVPLGGPAGGTVLIRTPYGRGFPGDLLDARVLAARGYHVLFQSCRGTFGSGGDFNPMVHEADDAQDTVAWLRRQPWFDGRLATLGASYMGWVQWSLLLDPPPELRTAVVLIAPHDMGRGVFGTGAFTLNDFLWWSKLVAHQERTGRMRGALRAARTARWLTPAFTELPMADAAERVLDGGAPWFRSWLSHPDLDDPFWDRLCAEPALQRVSVPVRLVGGWQDLFLAQTTQQYEVLHRRGVDVSLSIGPWTHFQVGTSGAGRVVRGNLAWLDAHLANGSATRLPPVEVYVTGAGTWRALPAWPPATTELIRYLQPGGRLTGDEPSGAGPSSSFYYDPADPTPTVGGRLLTTDAGVRDNAALEARPDVLTFTSAPLTAALEIAGTPVVELEHSRDNPFADVSVRLCDVDTRGRSRNVADAYLRLDPVDRPDGTNRLTLRLDPCCHRFAVGHRLRLQVSGGSHPRYARNEGTGAPSGTGRELRPTIHTVYHRPGAASRVVLPVPPAAGG